MAQSERQQSDDIPLVQRQWEPREVRDSGKYKVTIMTWNVLADGLSGVYNSSGKAKTFAGVEQSTLELEFRMPRILKEIERWECDIVCFQEYDFYKRGFEQEMQALGYTQGVVQTKRWSPCKSIDPRLEPDGVAIFFKTEKFEKINERSTDQLQHKRWMEKELREKPHTVVDGYVDHAGMIELMGADDAPHVMQLLDADLKQQENSDEQQNGGSPSSPSSRLSERWSINDINAWMEGPKVPVSAGCLLRPIADRSLSLYIMTTHLVATKKQQGEKQRIAELQDLINEPGHRDLMNGAHTFLLCDMNASHADINGYPPEAYPFLTGSLPGVPAAERGQEHFKSATRQYKLDDSEIEWTSWKVRNRGNEMQHMKFAVDYAFYPPQDWNVSRVSGLPSQQEMEEIKNAEGLEHFQIPNRYYPSDHLSICVEFQLA